MRLSYLDTARGFPAEWLPAVRYPLASTAVILSECDPLTAARAVAELARVLELDPDVLCDLIRQTQEPQ